MEERRTAAWVLGILALLALLLFIVLPRYKHNAEQTLAFRSCVVHFRYDDKQVADEDIYRSATSRLGLCLCKLYRQNPDFETRDSIMSIFNRDNHDSTGVTFTIDSVIKHKYTVFDTTITIE